MKTIIIKCPCCNNQIKISCTDTGKISGIFLNEQKELSQNELFDEFGICIGEDKLIK